MIIKNIGNELVFIGDILLNPGDKVSIANTIAHNPLVKVLAERGALQLLDGSSAKAKDSNNKKTAAVPTDNAKISETDTAKEKNDKTGKKSKKYTKKSK